MGTDVTSCVPLTSKSEDRVFMFGGGGERNRFWKPSWSTVREGDNWINCLVHGYEACIINEKQLEGNDGWSDSLLGLDWITKDIALEQLISKEVRVREFDLHRKLISLATAGGWYEADSFLQWDQDLGNSLIHETEEGIFAYDTYSEGTANNSSALRSSSSQSRSSKCEWKGGDMEWHKLDKKQRLNLMRLSTFAWHEQTVEENFIQQRCDMGLMEMLQGLREKEQCKGISKEIVSQEQWSVCSSRKMEQGNLGCKDGIVLDMQKEELASRREEPKRQTFRDATSQYDDNPGLIDSCLVDREFNKDMSPEALLCAFSYLNWHDLLKLEEVCILFRNYIRDDPLLWRELYVQPPFSKKLTDEGLLQLAARARGQLQCLSLIDCLRISESAVEQVVRSNPGLAKLCLPGCSRISADGVLRIVKDHMTREVTGMPGLQQLHVRNIYGLTKVHLESLQSLLSLGAETQAYSYEPQYYLNRHVPYHKNEQRPIDVEACPKCDNVRIVYDCTTERCQQRQGNKLEECRGCILCIARCEGCGRCINDCDYEETFCLDLLCSICWHRLPKCEYTRPGCGHRADHSCGPLATAFVYG